MDVQLKQLNRRQLLKLSALSGTGLLIAASGVQIASAASPVPLAPVGVVAPAAPAAPAAVPFAVQAIADFYKQWMIGATKPPGPVLPMTSFAEHSEKSFDLKNKAIRRFLQHEKQTWGINLGWTDDARNETGKKVARWFFTRNGTSQGPITYGETIALGNGGSPSFIRYASRTFGINLDWSNTPVFEWKILGGKTGTPVNTQSLIALYNVKDKEFLIYFDRTVGGDIGWPSSQTWWDHAGDLITAELKKLLTKENLALAATYLLSL